MEIVCVLLMLAFGLLMVRSWAKSVQGGRSKAGRLLAKATTQARLPRIAQGLMIFNTVLATALALWHGPLRFWIWLILASAVLLATVSLGIWTVAWDWRLVRLCEKGIAGPAPWAFIAWSRIRHCRRLSGRPNLRVQMRGDRMEFLLADNPAAAAWSLLPRYVQVLDESGQPLAADPTSEPPASPEPAGAALRPLQFGLLTPLLLVLTLSAFFSWVGIRYREEKIINGALAELSGFAPNVFRFGTRVTHLDFDNSPVKPGDEAMPAVGRLRDLTYLSLRGTHVTDAGLEHLERLQRLDALCFRDTAITDARLEHLRKLHARKSVILIGTQVTPEGVRRLRQALPQASIVESSPPVRPAPRPGSP